MVLPEDAQELVIANQLRVKHHPHDLRVAGVASADLMVGGIGRGAARVADGGGDDAGEMEEVLLGAPEAAHAEDRDLGARGREVQWGSEDVVRAGERHRGGAPGERLTGPGEARHRGADVRTGDEEDHRERERREGPAGGVVHRVVG